MKLRIILILSFCLTTRAILGESLYITSLTQDGTLTCTNSFTNGVATIEYRTNLVIDHWTPIKNVFTSNILTTVHSLTSQHQNIFYRIKAADITSVPEDMAYIIGGWFHMGYDVYDERSIYISAFYIDKYEVTKMKWDEVYNWATNQGYSFDNSGSSKATNYPVHTINWYDCVKWCNARSEKESLTPVYCTDSSTSIIYRTGQLDISNSCVRWDEEGYRLPTVSEWEKAARGGMASQRFPWGQTISHNQANYYSIWQDGQPYYSWDVSSIEGYHPDYTNSWPYTSPVGSFSANDYGLHDMIGNLWERCWDQYPSVPLDGSEDPKGSGTNIARIIRGGCFATITKSATYNIVCFPDDNITQAGCRTVRRPSE